MLVRYDLTPGPAGDPAELLPELRDPISLGERETPLLPAHKLSRRAGFEVWVKDDSGLPGGTFKARGAHVALSRARDLGVTRVVMPSAGNAGGAWAQYAARGGLELTVTMSNRAPATNQTEVRLAGAALELVEGSIADAGKRAGEIAAATGAFHAATFNEPYRLEGKKTAWLEVFARIGLPRAVILPVGGGVAAIAADKAAREMLALGWVHGDPPAIYGVQAETCAPIARAFERGLDEVEPWDGPADTVAAGLRVPAPVEGALVLRTIRASGGAVATVSEAEILDTIGRTASTEGIWPGPEGAAAIAALDKLELDGPAVVYNTGAGYKYAGIWGPG